MSLRLKLSQACSQTASALLLLNLLINPAVAHKVKVSGEIGGTMHIEPDDNPRAGQPAVTWFLLLRKNGQAITLESCNCQLNLYAEPYRAGDAPLQTPPLRRVIFEETNGKPVPGAEVTFPQVGSYELVLRGQPKTSGEFSQFELSFPVTVAQGKSTPTVSLNSTPTPRPSTAANATSSPTRSPSNTPTASSPSSPTATEPGATNTGDTGIGQTIAIAAAVILGAGGVWWFTFGKNRK